MGELMAEPVARAPPPLDFTTIFTAVEEDYTGGADQLEVDDLMPIQGIPSNILPTTNTGDEDRSPDPEVKPLETRTIENNTGVVNSPVR